MTISCIARAVALAAVGDGDGGDKRAIDDLALLGVSSSSSGRRWVGAPAGRGGRPGVRWRIGQAMVPG